MSPDQQLGHLSEALNLTDDQKGQIRPILEDRHQKMQSIHSDAALAEQDKKTKMHGIFDDSKIRNAGAGEKYRPSTQSNLTSRDPAFDTGHVAHLTLGRAE
jgi:LTXXQ motif family protein